MRTSNCQTPQPSQGSTATPVASRRVVRVGDYRISYTVDDKFLLVVVVTLVHRRDVYDR